MVLPLLSGRLASWMAAHTTAPEEIPTSTPSDLPIFRPVAKASSLSTGIAPGAEPVKGNLQVFPASGGRVRGHFWSGWILTTRSIVLY